MTTEAGELVLDLLSAGKISAVEGLTFRGRPAFGVANAITDRVRLNTSTFSQLGLGDFAALLAHESRHTQQAWLTMPHKADADADAYACANTWGRVRAFGGFYRAAYGPCGSGVR
jgi:hypothetical protein